MKRDSLNEKSFGIIDISTNETGWDLGKISPAIKKWFDNQKIKNSNSNSRCWNWL